MEFLKSVSIRTRLFMVCAIPTLGLIVLLYTSIRGSLEAKDEIRQVEQDCEEVEVLSSLLHELQRERAFYISYLASRTQQDLARITEQVPQTNAAVSSARNLLGNNQRAVAFLAHLDSLDFIREDTLRFPDLVNESKGRVLNEVFTIIQNTREVEIKNLLQAHLFLLYTKEYFVRTRNLLLQVFINKGFEGNNFARFVEGKAKYELSRDKFLSHASDELIEVYNRAASNSSVRQIRGTFDSLLQHPDKIPNYTATDWWNRSMAVINAQVEVESHSLRLIRGYAEEAVAAINQQVLRSLLGGVVTLLLVGLLVYYAIRHIAQSIGEIKRAAQKLALGEVDFTVNVTSNDELGDLATSFNKMVAVKKLYAETAAKIGKGNYDTEVLVRTNADILGIALTNMKNDLARLSRENEIRTWLLTSNGRLNDRMRGEKEIQVLANEVIAELTQILKGQVGTFYIRENGHLRRAGQYAHDGRYGPEEIISLGEGLVGQAAVEGKQITLRDIPDDYLTIRSSLGATKPKNIILHPFHYEGEVRGVAEIGSTLDFTDLDLQFLSMVSPHVGVAVNASQSREKLKELLEETQRQSEELETQQEELKQFNEELLEKTHLLEKSEEELKAQQEELQLSNEELIEKASLLEEQKQNLEFTKLQLESKAKELAQASQYKSEFLSNMSHELRTPLNSILILAQVLMENRNKTLSSKEIKFANTIYNSGNDLLSLINEILDLSKIEAGKMELDIAPFSLEVIIQNLTNAFEELARSKKIRFAIHCAEDLHQKIMVSDHQRIEQILKNFLSNAFKFTANAGKIELLINRASPATTLRKKSLQSNGDILSFSVVDNGIGIAEEKLSMIFDAFQQGDGSTKRKYGGTGLGLSISRELANMLGGEIHVSSQISAGSTFTLYIPAEIESTDGTLAQHTLRIQPTTPELPAVIDELPLTDASHYDDQHLITDGDRKILIMEDDVEFAKVLLDFVHERNYKGIIAHQGNIGLSYARHYKPDAIILDMKLPVLDGAEVLKKLKSDPELRHIPVQIISGYDYRKNSLELGAIDFIQKPITRESFWKALDKVEHFVARKPKKLLIIEDNKQQNQAVKELIGNGDVKCYSAFSGKEAYELLAKTSFDCIIVDLGLPDMTGFNFLEKIREDQELNRIPVIVYTGKDLTKDENARLEKLANTVVLKTAFSHERLLDETTLFLHRVESKLPKEKQNIIRKLHKTDEILKNKRVLIIDDDDRNVYSLLSALEPEGLKCFKASNGKEGLQVLEAEKKVDLILMDVMMPEMDGFEATKLIRKMPEYKKIPVIALTAKAMKDDREKCLAAGMSDYISKPLNVQQLLSLMRVWLYA